jgi:hypothetical protein
MALPEQARLSAMESGQYSAAVAAIDVPAQPQQRADEVIE